MVVSSTAPPAKTGNAVQSNRSLRNTSSLEKTMTRIKRIGMLPLLAAVLLVPGACGRDGATATGDAGSGSQEVRTVKHAMGETKVKGQPSRVVVLDIPPADAALALGVKPVGVVSVYQDGSQPSYLAKALEGVENVGGVAQPNLERIAALKPDLILSESIRHAKIYPQLSQIAPTVFVEDAGPSFKQNLEVFADALGRSAEATKLLDEYKGKIAALQKGAAQPVGGIQVSLARAMPGEVRMYQKGSFPGSVLSDVGVARPSAQQADKVFKAVTPESVADLDGDVLMVSTFGPDDTAMRQLQATPSWNGLNVVQRKGIQNVQDDYWFLGGGIQAATMILADLEKYLGEKK